jgi:hypothetical protein
LSEDKAGHHRVHSDTKRAKVFGELRGQADDPGFRSGIGESSGRGTAGTEGFEPLLHHVLDLSAIGDICRCTDDFDSPPFERGNHAPELIGLTIRHDQVGTGRCQCLGRRSADALGGSRHQRHIAIQSKPFQAHHPFSPVGSD